MNPFERIKLQDSYRAVFDTPDGKKVLEHICKRAHVFEPTFTPGDPHTTSFKEGQRHLALSILRFVNKDTKVLLAQAEEELTKED